MKKLNLLLTLALIGTTVSAQQSPDGQKPDKKHPIPQNKPVINWDTEPSAAPDEEMNVNEFQIKRKDLTGSVIKIEFDHVSDLKQTENGYIARLSFESIRIAEGMPILLPPEALEFFEDLANYKGPKKETVYIEVIDANIVRALGTRFSKKKPEGERYSW